MNVLVSPNSYGGEGARAAKRFHPVVLRAAILWATWLAVIVGLMALRAIYLIWNWDVLRDAPASKLLDAFAIGLRFDASAAAFACAVLLPLALLHLGPRASRWRWNLYALLLLSMTLPLMVLATVDSELVRAVGRRTSIHGLFLYRESDWHLTDIVRQFATLVCLGLAVMGGWVLGVLRGRRWILAAEARASRGKARSPLQHVWSVVLLLLSAALLTIAIRGGVTNSKPLGLIHTHPEPHLGNLALNTPFVMIKTIAKDNLHRLNYFGSRQALLAHLDGGVPSKYALRGIADRAQRPNVVVLVMESLSLGYMGEINGVTGYTPFLDELARRSLFLPNTWANATRSIDGIPAVVAGVPALGAEPLLTSQYATTRFAGLGTLLTQQGYDCAFFHAANRGSMFIDQLAVRAGFTRYYAKEDYPNPRDDDGQWGIFDEPYFQYVADQIEDMRRPFGVVVFSLTAHHPFRVPPHLADRFPDGPHPILKTIAYSDYALRRFFETARTRDWYQDTLFVITADHGFLPYLPQYRNAVGRWRVPLILHRAGQTWPAVDLRQPVAQIDIVPTIAQLIGARAEPHNRLTRSVFSGGERTVVLRAENSLFAVGAEYFLHYPLEGGEPQLYHIGDPERRYPITTRDDVKREMIARTRANLEYFNNGLLDGTLLQADPGS
jgi:hypothetical protein